jgi:hypothetical protein
MSEQAPGQTNTSGQAHCPHCGVCHTAEETCIRALQRLLALYEQRQPVREREPSPSQPDDVARAVGEYVANLKANLHPKTTCPDCLGSDDPIDQVMCADSPCQIGRDFQRPPLEQVIQQLEALLVPTATAAPERSHSTFIDLIEQAEAKIGRLAQDRDVSIEQLFPSGLRLRNAPLTLRALIHATNGGKAGQGNSVGWFDPNAAGCVRWKGGFVRGDFNEGDPIYCQSTVRGDTV